MFRLALLGKHPVVKVMVLRGYFELSGLSIHKLVANNHFLTISDEFGAEHERNMGGTSIGTFFPFRYPNMHHHYMKSALIGCAEAVLYDPSRTGIVCKKKHTDSSIIKKQNYIHMMNF